MFAIGCVGSSFHLFQKTAAAEDSIPSNFVVILTAIGLLAAAAVLIAPEILRIVSRPFTSLIDSIFFPREKSPKPELDYRLPEFYPNRNDTRMPSRLTASSWSITRRRPGLTWAPWNCWSEFLTNSTRPGGFTVADAANCATISMTWKP